MKVYLAFCVLAESQQLFAVFTSVKLMLMSCAKPDLTGYFGDCSPLHELWSPTGSSSFALLEGPTIYECTSHRSLPFPNQTSVRGTRHWHPKNEKTLGCSTSCFCLWGYISRHWSIRSTPPMFWLFWFPKRRVSGPSFHRFFSSWLICWQHIQGTGQHRTRPCRWPNGRAKVAVMFALLLRTQ